MRVLIVMVTRIYFRTQLCGISTNWKDMPHKIYIAASNGAQNKIKKQTYGLVLFFGNKIFENITDNNTDLTAVL